MGEYLNILNLKNKPSTPQGGNSKDPRVPPDQSSPFALKYIDPGDKTGADADNTQRNLSHRNEFVDYFDKAYYDKYMRQNPNNWMSRAIASWVDDPIHMNDRRGNINGKNFYATRNLARLADRFNNEFTFAGGTAGMSNAEGNNVQLADIQYEQNPQLNTMEQRQYEDNRGVANRLRESDVGIIDTLNKAVPDSYKLAQQQMVNYRDYVGRMESDLNKAVRDASIKINYTLPWDQYFAEVVNYFAQNVPRHLDIKLANFLKNIPNDVWKAFYAQVTRAGTMPTNEQVLMSAFQDTVIPAMVKQGASAEDITRVMYEYTYDYSRLAQDYMLRNNLYSMYQTYGTYKNALTGKGNIGSVAPSIGLPSGYENILGE